MLPLPASVAPGRAISEDSQLFIQQLFNNYLWSPYYVSGTVPLMYCQGYINEQFLSSQNLHCVIRGANKQHSLGCDNRGKDRVP